MVFRCTIAHPKAGCFLYLEGRVQGFPFLSGEQDYILSHVHKGNEGRYSCQCFTRGALFEWSTVSKTLDLAVRGETSPQPHPTLLFLPGICHILGELDKKKWGKKAAVIGGQAEEYSFLQMCLSLPNSSETLQMM